MPQSRSKRKGKKHAGRGRTHRLAGVPFTIVRHFPFTDEERRDSRRNSQRNPLSEKPTGPKLRGHFFMEQKLLSTV